MYSLYLSLMVVPTNTEELACFVYIAVGIRIWGGKSNVCYLKRSEDKYPYKRKESPREENPNAESHQTVCFPIFTTQSYAIHPLIHWQGDTLYYGCFPFCILIFTSSLSFSLLFAFNISCNRPDNRKGFYWVIVGILYLLNGFYYKTIK